VRLNNGCIHVIKTNLNAGVCFDPKIGSAIADRLSFSMQGQKPYGEWLKRAIKNNKAPRGKCGKYFAKHAHLKTSY